MSNLGDGRAEGAAEVAHGAREAGDLALLVLRDGALCHVHERRVHEADADAGDDHAGQEGPLIDRRLELHGYQEDPPPENTSIPIWISSLGATICVSLLTRVATMMMA